MSAQQVPKDGAAIGDQLLRLHAPSPVDAPRLTMGAQFPPILRSVCAQPAFDLEEGGVAHGVRATEIDGAPWLVAARFSGPADIVAFAAPLAGPRGADLQVQVAATLPDFLDAAGRTGKAAPPAVTRLRPKDRSLAEKAAGRLFSALGAPGPVQGDAPPPVSAALEAGDDASFWRAVAAFLELFPSAARAGVSAWSGPTPTDGFWATPLLTRADRTADADAGASVDAAALLKRLDTTPDLEGVGGGPGCRHDLFRRLSAALDDEGLSPAAHGHFSRADAPAPLETGADAPVLIAHAAIARLEGEAQKGAADFGAARAVGWLAARLDAETLWPRLLSHGAPARWRALSLAEAEEAAPALSLQDLAALHRAEVSVRAAASEAVETPFDAPVFKARRANAAEATPRLLTADPLALLASPGSDFASDLKKALEGKRVDPRKLATPLDAIAFAADLPARETDAATLAALAEAGSALRLESGLAAIGRFGQVNVEAKEPVAARYFGGLWLRAEEFASEAEHSPVSGPAFWRDRWLAWVEAQAGDAAAVLPVRRALRNAAAETAGAAGAIVLAEPLIATLSEVEQAPEKPRAADAPRTRGRRIAPSAPQSAHMRDEMADAMRALRESQGAENTGDGAAARRQTVAPGSEQDADPAPESRTDAAAEGPRAVKSARGGRKAPRMGADVDRAALEDAVTLFRGYMEDFTAERARRADGADARPIALQLGEKKRAVAALDAAVAQSLDAAQAASDLFGPALAWGIRTLAGLGRKSAGRPSLEPGPVELRAAWSVLAAGDAEHDALAPLAALAACLQAERDRAIGTNNRLTAGMQAALHGASVTKLIGSESVSFSKTTLRDFVFATQPARGPALSDAALDGARMDRLLLTLTVLQCVEDERQEPSAGESDALLRPLAIDAESAGVKALTPPAAMQPSLSAYLQSRDTAATEQARAFARLLEERRFFSSAGLMKLWRTMK